MQITCEIIDEKIEKSLICLSPNFVGSFKKHKMDLVVNRSDFNPYFLGEDDVRLNTLLTVRNDADYCMDVRENSQFQDLSIDLALAVSERDLSPRAIPP